MYVEEPSVLDKEKQAGLMKRARWNVRLIPFGFAALVAGILYLNFAPPLPVSLLDNIAFNLIFCGLLVWLEHSYRDEKYLLETGRQRTSVGYTVGLFICLTGLSVSLYYDKKPQIMQWFCLVMLAINVITGASKHIAAYQKQRRGLNP